MKEESDRTLHVWVGGLPAAVLRIGSGQWGRKEDGWIDGRAAFGRLSVGWQQEVDGAHFLNWLECLLPEGGALAEYEARAREVWSRGDLNRGREIWANADREYPGAVQFTRGGTPKAWSAGSYERVGQREMGQLLRGLVEVQNTEAARWPARTGGRRSYTSAAGFRPKIGVYVDPQGRWHVLNGQGITSHLFKVEDDERRWPAEAGMEALCQEALKHVGVQASETRTEEIDGVQTIISKRSDREEGGAGQLVMRHQEDWLQASGLDPVRKFGNRYPEPGWDALYALFRAWSGDPRADCRRLTRFLAASVMLGHCDLHRRNVGVRHTGMRERFAVELAPAYDVSTSAGLGIPMERWELALPIGGESHPGAIGAAEWDRHADACGESREEVRSIVKDVAQRLPDAVAQAAADGREDNDVRNEAAWRKRIDALQGDVSLQTASTLQSLSGAAG